MEFANETERQEWIAGENKRVTERNAAVIKESSAAVEKARAEREEKLKNAPDDAAPLAHPGLGRRPGRVPDGTAVATPAGPGDDEDDAAEFEGDDDEFEDEDELDPDEDEDDEDDED